MNNFNKVDQRKNNTLRQIEINEYYSLKNKAIIEIFKIIIVGSIPLIIIAILSKINIIPNNILSALSMIIILLLTVLVLLRVISINSRDPRNFNSYNIPFDANASDLENAGSKYSMSNLLNKEFNIKFGCFNDACCGSNMKFDSSKKKCVLNSDNFESVENSSTNTNSATNSASNSTTNSATNSASNIENNFVKSISNFEKKNIDPKLNNVSSLVNFDQLSDKLRNLNLLNIHKDM
tara:strand:+ start:433 stop:1140 length:708 start_codon:yes stop_codon:yes gene_type:complete